MPRSGTANTGPGCAGALRAETAARGECVDLRDGLETEAVGVGGVDAAHQGVDETFVHLPAESTADEGADGVTVRHARQDRFDARAQLAERAEESRHRERAHLRGHPHENVARDLVQAVVPHVRARAGGRGECRTEAEVAG